jgi:hypothetical protein
MGCMMTTFTSKENLINSYNVLFGPYTDVSYEVLKELQPSELKAAYRKKAFETHPDRSKIVGRDEDRMNREFIKAAMAYEKLISIIKDKNKHVFNEKRDVKESRAKYYNTRDVFPDHYYKGSMPKRKLLLGQFLYYSGLISWKTLISAISWQKRQRPLIGQIAMSWGMLSSFDIKSILEYRAMEGSYKEKFCKYAWSKGYINLFERMALVGKQRSLQRPIGEYFTKEEGIFSAGKIEILLENPPEK